MMNVKNNKSLFYSSPPRFGARSDVATYINYTETQSKRKKIEKMELLPSNVKGKLHADFKNWADTYEVHVPKSSTLSRESLGHQVRQEAAKAFVKSYPYITLSDTLVKGDNVDEQPKNAFKYLGEVSLRNALVNNDDIYRLTSEGLLHIHENPIKTMTPCAFPGFTKQDFSQNNHSLNR